MKKVPKGYTAVSDEYPQIDEGAPVYINRNYVRDGENPRKYFVCELSRGNALIADSKKDLSKYCGHIYSIWSIDSYKNFGEV